jgi:hypothetical protein
MQTQESLTMNRRLLVLLACIVLCAGTQLACTSDSPPSVALREQGQAQPKRAEPQGVEEKKVEEKRGDIEAPELPSPNVPGGLELLVEQIGPAPLPHQSVRLRLTLRNSGKQEIKQLRIVDGPCFLRKVKGPRDVGYRYPDKAASPRETGTYGFQSRDLFRVELNSMWANERLTLKPGDRIAVSGTFGPWQPGDGVFSEPGDYLLEMAYVTDDFTLRAKPYKVKVAKPTGDDAEAVKLLSDNKSQLDAVIFCLRTSHIALGGQTASMLEKLIRKYPKTSYADYARLALTRSGPVKQLADVNTQQFALGADVLLLLRKHAKDKVAIEQIETKLATDYYDSYEWIKDQAERVTYAELMERRKPPAERKQLQPAKP